MELNDARYAKLVARSWMDSSVRQQLMENPEQALKEAGVPIQDGVSVRCREGELQAAQSREQIRALMSATSGQVVELTVPPIPAEFAAAVASSGGSAFPSSGLGGITQLAVASARDINTSVSVSVTVVAVAVVVTTVSLS